jgi:hypothetical protein
VERLDVLPVLLEERGEEVNGSLDVLLDLILSQFNVSDGDSEARSLLELELNLAIHLVDLGLEIISMSHRSRELASLVQTRTKQTGDLLEDGLRSNKTAVTASEVLDLLFVLLEGGKGFDVHGGEADALGNIHVEGITKDTNIGLEFGGVGQLDNTRETLVFHGVVGLETDLEFDGLNEASMLLLRFDHHLVDEFLQSGGVQLAHGLKGIKDEYGKRENQ